MMSRVKKRWHRSNISEHWGQKNRLLVLGTSTQIRKKAANSADTDFTSEEEAGQVRRGGGCERE